MTAPRTPPSVLGVKTTPAPARFTAGVSPSGVTQESVIAALYGKHVLTKAQVASAVVKLKLSLSVLAAELGLSGPKQLLEEFINDPTDNPVHESQTFTPFSYEEAVLALYSNMTVQEVAAAIGRTPKAVTNFKWRSTKQGLRVNRSVYELIAEGEKLEDINQLGFPAWMVKFTETVFMLLKHATLHRLEPIKVEFTE